MVGPFKTLFNLNAVLVKGLLGKLLATNVGRVGVISGNPLLEYE